MPLNELSLSLVCYILNRSLISYMLSFEEHYSVNCISDFMGRLLIDCRLLLMRLLHVIVQLLETCILQDSRSALLKIDLILEKVDYFLKYGLISPP